MTLSHKIRTRYLLRHRETGKYLTGISNGYGPRLSEDALDEDIWWFDSLSEVELYWMRDDRHNERRAKYDVIKVEVVSFVVEKPV